MSSIEKPWEALPRNIAWMRNRAWSLAVNPPPLIFYHIPKTGGEYLYKVLRGALVAISHAVSRTRSDFEGFNENRIDLPEHIPAASGLRLIGTHLPYGWHRQEGALTNHNPITLVRQPFDRIRSSYTYDCMRAGRRPSVAEFQRYSLLPANRNAMVRYLGGGDPACEGIDVDAVIECLEREFLAYDTLGNVTQMVEGLLNYANLSDVITLGRINTTLPEYSLDLAEFKEEVEALNAADMQLYRYVSAKPRRLEIPSTEGYHPYTALIKETGDASASKTAMIVVDTESLLDAMAKASSRGDVIESLFSKSSVSNAAT